MAITKAQAQTAKHFEHAECFNKDGTKVRARANGKCQTWKTRPNDFKLPIKSGLYWYGYITQDNCDGWNAVG